MPLFAASLHSPGSCLMCLTTWTLWKGRRSDFLALVMPGGPLVHRHKSAHNLPEDGKTGATGLERHDAGSRVKERHVGTSKARALRKATYEDLLELPSHQLGEILDGTLIVSPRPAAAHANAASALAADLRNGFGRRRGDGGRPGGWRILFEPVHLEDDVVVPDLAGWRREGMPELPDVPAFTSPPDWLCEVISPSSGRIDRVIKLHSGCVSGCAR